MVAPIRNPVRRFARRITLLLLAMLAVWPLSAQSAPPFVVDAAFDTAWAYPGQAVLYTVTAYSDTARDVTFDMPAFEGFWQADSRAFSSTATREGKQYNVTVYQVSLYPQRVGLTELAPARADFAETVFSAGASRLSNTASLEVVALPPAPDGFSGLVGAVGAQLSAEPMVARIGEPVDVTLRLQGAANLAQFAPQLDPLEGWRIYAEPRESQSDFDGSVLTQTRIVRWRAVPDRAGRFALSLPPLIYFTLAGGYETLDIPPLDFEILPAESGALSREALVSDVSSRIQAAAPQSAPAAAPLPVWLIAPLAAFAVLAGRDFLRRWRLYQANARKRNALRRATHRLRAAAHVGGELAAIESAVTGYFADHAWALSAHAEATALLVAVESERYHPDGARHAERLARRAADLLRRLEDTAHV